ncbi:hypothetical protein WJ967_16435 [Achromobacter xylosoxidans]
MLIVIPGALPALPVAAELAKLLPQRAPTLHRWLQAGSARVQAHDIRTQGCTAFEAWQLRRAGYTPEAGLLPGAGLGPLLAAGQPADGPVWLAELVHLALGTDQATLLDPALMELRDDETAALLDTARPCSKTPASRSRRCRPPAGACACRTVCGRRPPAPGGGRPAPERLVAPGCRNPAMAPSAQ